LFLKYSGLKGIQRVGSLFDLSEVFQLTSVGAVSDLSYHKMLVAGKAQRNIVLRMKGPGTVCDILCWNFYYTRMSEGMKYLKEEREKNIISGNTRSKKPNTKPNRKYA